MPFSQPTDISGAFLWYKSTGNSSNNHLTLPASGKITYWQDLSGSGNNLNLNISGAKQAPQYIPNVCNGYPAIRFNGLTNYMQCTPNNDTFNLAPSSLTIFTLYQTFNYSNYQVLIADGGTHLLEGGINDCFGIGLNQIKPSSWDFSWGQGDGSTYLNVVASSYHEGFSLAPPNQFLLRTDTFDSLSRNFAFYKFGAECATGIANTKQSSSNTLTVGGSFNQTSYLSGDIIEIVAYNRIISSGELQTLSSYFFQKYQLQNTLPCPLFLYADTPSGLFKNLTVYMSGGNRVINTFPLYTDSSTPIHSSTTLYTDSSTPINSSIKLYIDGKGFLTNNTTLYLDSATAIHSSLTLYTDSSTPIHSSIKLYMNSATKLTSNIPLYLDCSTKISGHMTLYTDSSTPIHSGFTLYTSGSIGSQHANIKLYLNCSTPINSSINLFLPGGTGHINSHFTLYIDSASKITSGWPLYTQAITSGHTNMPLYIHSTPHPTGQNNLSLFIDASHAGTSGLYHDLPLYMYGTGPHSTMSLYIGVGGDHPRSNMPLFISGPVNTGHGSFSIPLYLANSVSGTPKGGILPLVKLYTRGAGQLDGASIAQGSMPLYLRRGNGNTATMSLYVCAGKSTSGVNLYTQGANFAHGGINMVVAGTGVKNTSTLYVHGPTPLNSGIKMYIAGYPEITTKLPLYVGGF